MKTYVVVHGAWGGAWEFDQVSQILSNDENKVIAIDLPGHESDNKDRNKMTMQAYIDKVVEVVNQQPNPVILVGHSLGGMIISQVAEQMPKKIDRLIYIAAMLPKTGDVALQLMESDKDGQLLSRVEFSEDQSFASINRSIVEKILLNDLDDIEALNDIAPKMIFNQSTEPFMAVAKLSNENFGKVKKYYIRATNDKVLSPTLQNLMIKNWKIEEVYTLASGHFPMVSMPMEVTEIMKKASLQN